MFRLAWHGQWDQFRRQIAAVDPQGRTFAAFAVQHHLCQSLLARIANAGAAEFISESSLHVLREEDQRCRAKTARLAAVMQDIDREFERAGVQSLALKGIVFAQRYFGDMFSRRQGDLDVLVRRDDLPRAMQTLTALGFAAKPRRLAPVAGGLAVRNHRLRTEHAMTLRRDDLSVDVHWSLRTAPAYRFDDSVIWNTAQPVNVVGRTFRTLSDEHALALLLVSIAHDIGRGACKVKHIVDVAQLLAAAGHTIEWHGFFQRREDENTLKIAVNVLRLCVDAFEFAERVPFLTESLARYCSLISPSTSTELISRGKGNPQNNLWFMEVYPTRWVRDGMWLIDRGIPHPSRVFNAAGKTARLAMRYARHFLGMGG